MADRDGVEALREVVALAGKATPGEWSAGDQSFSVSGHDPEILGPFDAYIAQTNYDGQCCRPTEVADGQLIAAAVNWTREHAPQLLAEVDALRARIRELEPQDEMTADEYEAAGKYCATLMPEHSAWCLRRARFLRAALAPERQGGA